MRHFTQIIQKRAIFYSDFFIIWSITLLSICTIKKVTLLQTENKERQMLNRRACDADLIQNRDGTMVDTAAYAAAQGR